MLVALALRTHFAFTGGGQAVFTVLAPVSWLRPLRALVCEPGRQGSSEATAASQACASLREDQSSASSDTGELEKPQGFV